MDGSDFSSKENEDVLSDHPDDQAVEFDDGTAQPYVPFPDKDSSVVIVEPTVISIGRQKHREALRTLPPKSSNQ
jgi:hypothetical protein